VPSIRHLLTTVLLATCLTAADNHLTWSEYGGSADSAQFSAIKQINRLNVANLKVAWSYPTADGNKYLFNPIVVHSLMYVMAKNNSIVALNAATGREVWVHKTDPAATLITNRGINYWESPDSSDRRLFFAMNNMLQAIDARTGQSIQSFGAHGLVDLRVGLGRDPATLTLVQSTTPGRVFENLLILGSATNSEYSSAPGDIRAYDTRTGQLVWTFHTIPHTGEFGADTWPTDAWKTIGGANSWSEFTLDQSQGVVYIPTASPKYNFYGANRKGMDLFGDCLLALDARTGKRLWHFQMVHHDIWDYDNATAPKLLTVMHAGKPVDIVALAGKQGFLWVFNRKTGEPLWPIEERPVPKSDMPAEEAWPTQPFPVKPPPFARQSFTAKDISPFIADPAERARLFTPPGKRNTIEMPGNNGGANFGGSAIDPATGMFYVVSKDLPSMLKLQASQENSDPALTQYKSGFGFMFTSSGLPAIAPPWTSLTAYDLNEGAIKWKMPLGEVPELAAKGFKDTGAQFPKTAPVVTAGGLLFAGTRDRILRALDSSSGKQLWQAELPAALEGMPAIYEIDGREYIVVCASAQATTYTHNVPGHPAAHEPIPGAYVAFALP
jgi:quinoprotein glucose dehydrogenase